MKKQIPNLVSSLRVLASPFLAYAKTHNSPGWAFVLFIFIGITDYADGYLAIRLKATSDFGKRWVDPLCDFAAALGVLYGFVYQDENREQRLLIATTLITSTVLLKFAKEQWWWLRPRLTAFASDILPIYYCVCVAVFLFIYAAPVLDPAILTIFYWLAIPIALLLSYPKRNRFREWLGSLRIWIQSFIRHTA